MLGQKKISRLILLSKFHSLQNSLITFGQTNSVEAQVDTSTRYKISTIPKDFILNKQRNLIHAALSMNEKKI